MSPIASMFDRISPKYDTLNHLLSLDMDKVWRQRTAREVAKRHPKTILDLATGTADLAISLAKHNPQAHIIGMDFSERMLEIGKAKIAKQGLGNQIELLWGDAANLPFEDSRFDAITVAFGVRNFEYLEQGLIEIHRVLKPSRQVFILEFSMPEKLLIKQVYRLYFKQLLPKIGELVSKDGNAYAYLPQSVERFPKPKEFMKTLSHNGLVGCTAHSISLGIATLYSATKT